MNIKQNFLSPINLLKIMSYLNVTKENAKDTEEQTPYLLCKVPDSNQLIAVLLKSNSKTPVTSEFVNWFFKAKADSLTKKEFVLKIKNELEEDEEEISYVENKCDELNLNRKEGREWEKKYFDEKSEQIATNNKLLKPGSIIRVALSYNGYKEINYNGKTIPLIDSLALITVSEDNSNGEKEEKIGRSGLFYIAQTRHELPISLIINKKNTNKYNVILNDNIASVPNYITLLQHSIRTVKIKNGFFLFFFNKQESNKELSTILDNLNSSNKTNETYIENINSLIELIKNDNSIINSFKIYFPLQIDKSLILNDTEVLVTKLAAAITSISLSQQYSNAKDKQELLDKVNGTIKNWILEKSVTLYGIYSILSLAEEFESDTYGFLSNNIKKFSLTFGLEDTINLINEFKIGDFEENSKSEGVKVTTTQDGSLDF